MMQEYRVADWMRTPVLTITPDASLASAREMMEQGRIRWLPVVEQGRLVGLIAWEDLCAVQPVDTGGLSTYEVYKRLDELNVGEHMLRSPLTIAPDDSVVVAAQQMIDRGVDVLPVVAGLRLLGIVTAHDLLRVLIGVIAGAPHQPEAPPAPICHHCGTVLHGKSLTAVGPDDTCWHCHYHLHRCQNCRYYDGVTCMLNREDRFTPVPGRYCTLFGYRASRVSSVQHDLS